MLLIVAALDDEELESLLTEARAIGLDVLVEVHDETELGRALAAGADLVGVNNRNLRTLAVDVDASRRLARLLPPHVLGVAESGLKTAEDLAGSSRRRVPGVSRRRTVDDGCGSGSGLARAITARWGRRMTGAERARRWAPLQSHAEDRASPATSGEPGSYHEN